MAGAGLSPVRHVLAFCSRLTDLSEPPMLPRAHVEADCLSRRADWCVAWILSGLTVISTCPALAQSSADQNQPAPEGKGGCWSMGKWYAHGSVQPPDPRSRIAMPGSFVCRDGKWVFDPNRR